MKKTTLIALAATGVLASGAAAAAPTAIATHQDWAFAPVQYHAEQRAANIEDRLSRINERIERGIRDGRITDHEARRLYRELHDVRAKERSYRRDNGRIGPREADDLNRDLDRLAQDVRHQLRDEQRY